MTAVLERGEAGDGWAQGRVGNVVFLIYHACTPDEAVTHSFELIDRSISRHPLGIAIVAAFGERAPALSAQTRRRVAAYLTGVGDRVLIGSTVIEGDSTTATVKRVATAMVTTVLKPHYPHKTLRSIPQACDFVARCAVDDHGAPLAQGALFLAATSLRAALPMETPIELR